MTEFRGFVAKIGEKSGRGKNGKPYTVYSAKLEKEDGTEYDEWLSLGFERPNFKEGDYVKCEASKNDRGYMAVDIDSVKVAKNPPARAPKKGGSGKSSGGASGTGGGEFNRQTNPEDAKRMSYANARTAAVELTDLLLRNDALPITAAKGKSAEAKRYEEIVAAVDKLTVKFYNDGISLRLLETVADTKVDTAADGELPDKADAEAAAPEGEPEADDDDNF